MAAMSIGCRVSAGFNSIARLGSCYNSLNPSRGLSVLCASNKLQKNGINCLSNTGLVPINRGCYTGSPLIRLPGIKLGNKYFIIGAPENWPSVPIVPIKSTSLLPVRFTGFKITDENLIEVLKRKMAEDEPYVGVFLVKDENNESKLIKNADDIYPIGAFARIYKLDDFKDFTIIAVIGHRRISFSNLRNFEEEGDEESYSNGKTFFADIHNVTHEEFHYNDEMKKLVGEILKTIKDVSRVHVKHGRLILSELQSQKKFYEDPVNLSDFCASLAFDSAKPEELQQVLEERNIHKRLQLGLSLLKKDFEWRSKIPETGDRSFMINMPFKD